MLKLIKKFIMGDKENNGIKWSLYGRIWREIGRPQWKWLLGGIIFTILAAAAEGYAIIIVKQVVDETFIAKNLDSLYIIGLQIIASYGGKGVFGYIRSMVMTRAGLLASVNLQKRIYRHMVRMNISKFYGDGIGKHLNYFGVQAGGVLGLVTGTIISVVQNIATLIFSLGLMIWYAPQMCVLLLFLAPAIMIPTIIIMRKKRKLTRESFEIANDSSQQLNQTLHGIKTIQAFANEDNETEKFARVLNNSANNTYKNTKISALQTPLMEIMISIGMCLALMAGGYLIIDGTMSMGAFVAFMLALTAAYKPAKGITGTGNTIQHGLLSAEVLFGFLDSKPTIRDAKDAVELSAKKMSVEFDDVSFEYVAGDPVLKNVSLRVPAGSVCALVGPSGGGKTTTFNLLERFYDPQNGKIEINGKDIRGYTLKSLRKNIAEVSQDVFLFNGTIGENIRYGAPRSSQRAIESAAMAANAHDFIMEFPKGYDTPVGERGALLSGGQKQRIAIARAILKDAPLLLLDEATSALDTQSERMIQDALAKLMKGRTTFVIAHRLSTILDSDIICVIKNGEIIERGTDAELVALNGEYKKLRDIQFREKKKK